MSNQTQMIGASHVKRATALLNRESKKAEWPYYWLFPPASADDVIVTGGVALPAKNISPAVTYTLVLQYNVPAGMAFILCGVVAQAETSAGAKVFAPGSGDLVFVLDVNEPLNTPVPMGAPVKGFNNLTVPLGGFEDSNYWYLSKPRLFDPLDELRWKVTNNAVTVNDPNLTTVSCGLFGYTIPVDETL